MLRLELTIRKSQVAKRERGAKQLVRPIHTVRATPQSLVRALLPARQGSNNELSDTHMAGFENPETAA